MDKTANDWEERDCFLKENGKYDLVKLDYGTTTNNANGKDQRVTLKKPGNIKSIESLLPAAVQILIQLISDLKSMEESVTELKYDARRAPLGKLTKPQVKAGYSALNKISDCINALTAMVASEAGTTSGEKGKRGRPKRVPSNAGSRRKLEESLLMACNEFYTRIPHDFGMRVPPLLRSMEDVKQKLDLLQALDDIEFAVTIMQREHSGMKENPLDSRYKQLECNIRPMETNELMYTILKDYLQLNHGATHNWYTIELIEIFECVKPREMTNFKDLGNRMLLWHGSRLTNWVGILGRGLKVAPPEAPVTGYMFGKGIYFADCSSKSANYIFPTKKKNIGLLALCEVSLGMPNELLQADYNASKLPAGKHSVKGVGAVTPDEGTWKRLDDGLVVPVGKLINPPKRPSGSLALQFNEYIVYNPTQVRLRYLMKVRFNFS